MWIDDIHVIYQSREHSQAGDAACDESTTLGEESMKT